MVRGVGVWRVGGQNRDTTLLPTFSRSPRLSHISSHVSSHPPHCPHRNTLSAPFPTSQTHFATPQTHFHTPTPIPHTTPYFPTPQHTSHTPNTPSLTSPHTPIHFPTPSIFHPYSTQLPQPPKSSQFPHHLHSPKLSIPPMLPLLVLLCLLVLSVICRLQTACEHVVAPK